MAHISSHILIHSKNSLPVVKKLLSPHQKTPITYVEHVNYIGCYPEQNGAALRDRLGIKEDQFVFLFTGNIRPYKNIEIMIRAFRKAALPNAVLLIAGHAHDKAYADSLTAMIGADPTIRFEEGIIPDDSMCAYLSAANVMVLPHSKTSALNSGMMIMAFSYALPVITTDIAMAQDFPGDILWQYTYRNRTEKLANLTKIMITAYSAGVDQNRQMGLEAQRLMRIQYNARTISEKLKSIYES